MRGHEVTRRTLLGGLAAAGAVAGTGCGAGEGAVPRAAPTTPPPPSASPGPHPSVAPVPPPRGATQLQVLARDVWASGPPEEGWAGQVPARLTVHQSAWGRDELGDAVAHVRFLESDNRDQGWVDTPYHLLVDWHGNVYQGRDPRTQTQSNTPYEPEGHLTVCLLGMFDFEPLPEAQRDGAVAALAWAATELRIATDTIAGHLDFAPVTPCPGEAVHSLLRDGSLRARVEGLLEAGGPEVELLAGAAGRERLAEIEALG